MDKMDNRELMSALADGQLQGDDFARAVRATAMDAGARQAWCAYHVVGEVLRTGAAAPAGTGSEAFLARLQQRLQSEATVAPLPVVATAAIAVNEPANDWQWKLVAGLASVMAVAAVGWNVWGTTAAGSAQPQLAAVPAPTDVMQTAAETPILRDPRLDQLLQAHRQLGGSTALGGTSGFLRNATFEGPAR